MSFTEIRNQKAAMALVENLKKRRFDAYYCEDRTVALAKALELIPESDVVSFGGSFSVDAIGIKEALNGRGQRMIDRSRASSPEEANAMQRQALLCDTFLMSANAVSADGQLVNIDGNGNRVAALCYGPTSVLIVIGANKIMPDLESAVKRARNVAAPTNAQRFPLTTPCKVSGSCADCLCPDSICSQMVITRLSRVKGRIKILVLPESLGF